IHATVVDLYVGCKVSTRDIICHLKNTMDYHLSIGSVTNILALRAKEGVTPRRVVPGSLRAGCFSAGKI
ncbi:hypothetical protein, partial [Legionella sp. km772]|uniref:hypothetical protein n=1 Tax=Legionella sp. km772 TaxID=2498111 RepID=UPI001F24C5BB